MQMRRFRQTAVARTTDSLSLRDILANLDIDVAQMGKQGGKAVIVDDLDHPAHTTADVVARVSDYTVGRGRHLGADAGAEVHAAVQTRLLYHRMLAHAEPAGDGGVLQRVPAGDGAEHQAFFKCGMAGYRNSLRHRQRGRWIDADDRLQLLEVVAERNQLRCPRGHPRLQLRLTFEQLFVFLLDRRVAIAEIHEIGIESFDAAGEHVNHQQAT